MRRWLWVAVFLTSCGYAADSPEQAVREFLRYSPGSPTPSYSQIQSRLCNQMVEGVPLPQRILRLYDTLDDSELTVDYAGVNLTPQIQGNRATVTVTGAVKHTQKGVVTTKKLTGEDQVLTLIRTGGRWQICPH
ncbi:hypothetical protein GlitD10_0362 [Gloeomargarita lithophora Alchichica-D10]|uniref:DUF4878 domain-containing protein n=1 Tax=Gloeomargarita lithophora Alchichica-D10 TaxID=1188229 RepID=A0A1J0A9Q6_9CYAN|nr:hypothetical protein [Gloeomargarita lithophora]APB32672.1 hypothetical protein GlitD10_0362 [Gloeomargarita lithophora Alchichica-D10]